jgi:hypothetical protein
MIRSKKYLRHERKRVLKMKKEIKAQCLLEGEEARLWQLLRNKRHFLESALRLIYKDETINDFFFKESPTEEAAHKAGTVKQQSKVEKQDSNAEPIAESNENTSKAAW